MNDYDKRLIEKLNNARDPWLHGWRLWLFRLVCLLLIILALVLFGVLFESFEATL